MSKQYLFWGTFNTENVTFAMGPDKAGKPSINMLVQPNCTGVAFVTPACVTNWPRLTGDGNFGTMWGPTDANKAKFTLDLTDSEINGSANDNYAKFATILNNIDDKLLDFVHNNQLRLLGRKNLTREEVAMLQIRTVRPKYDKVSGQPLGNSIQATTAKYGWDGLGGRVERRINICDRHGKVIPDGTVAPGDVVAATIYANQVYTGVGGDKFGIHWSMEDVSVVCQRSKLDTKTSVPAFAAHQYEFGHDYEAMAVC